MKKGNLIIAFVLEGLGSWIVIDSYRMGLQTFVNPGAGLFPFLLGILLCLLALPICIRSLKDLSGVNKFKKEEKWAEYHTNLKKIGVTLVCLTGYFLLLDILGFLITSFLFLFGLFLIGNSRKWIFNSVFSAVVVALAYLIFNILLQIPFPSGFWR